MPPSSLPSRVLKMLAMYRDQGKKNWLSRSMTVYSTFQSFTSMPFDVFLSKTETAIKGLVKNKFQQMYQNKWVQSINDIDMQPKLRTFCKFKKEISLEPYLSLIIPKQRLVLSRFRCSAHHLAIETERHQKPKVPVDNRICLECKVIEDEEHHLIHCSKNEEFRKVLFEVANSTIENFCDLAPAIKFKQLMSCENLKLQKAIAIFLIESGN